MSRWLGDSGAPILSAIGVSFDDYGIEGDDKAGWASASLNRKLWLAITKESSKPVSMRSYLMPP